LRVVMEHSPQGCLDLRTRAYLEWLRSELFISFIFTGRGCRCSEAGRSRPLLLACRAAACSLQKQGFILKSQATARDPRTAYHSESQLDELAVLICCRMLRNRLARVVFAAYSAANALFVGTASGQLCPSESFAYPDGPLDGLGG
jgi:hypothetical protein